MKQCWRLFKFSQYLFLFCWCHDLFWFELQNGRIENKQKCYQIKFSKFLKLPCDIKWNFLLNIFWFSQKSNCYSQKMENIQREFRGIDSFISVFCMACFFSDLALRPGRWLRLNCPQYASLYTLAVRTQPGAQIRTSLHPANNALDLLVKNFLLG